MTAVNTSPTLTNDSSPIDIYTVCTTYALLRQHKHLTPVQKLIANIAQLKSRRNIIHTSVAFTRHRAGTLNGTISKRSFIDTTAPTTSTVPVESTQPPSQQCVICSDHIADARSLLCPHTHFCDKCYDLMYITARTRRQNTQSTQAHLHNEPVVFRSHECRTTASTIGPSSTLAPPAIASDLVSQRDITYRDNITISMHLCTLNIDKRIFDTNAWLCDDSINLALHHFNRTQGLRGTTLFISSLLLQQRVDLHPLTKVDGRQPTNCDTIVKCINRDGNHWIAVTWCRLRPTTVFILDSSQPFSHKRIAKRKLESSYHTIVANFVQFCEHVNQTDRNSITVDVLNVAQQTDGSSCGLFVIEFCRILSCVTADITTEDTRRQLREITVSNTREWLSTLASTLGLTSEPRKRSPAASSNKSSLDVSKAADAIPID